MTAETAIRIRGLRKSYGEFEAVRGIDLDVRGGEVFGLLGPNGAGKTTTVEILEGLRDRTSGEVQVLGFDPGVKVRELKDRIGVCLQATALPDKLKVHEALDLFGSLYSRRVDKNSLLARLQLSEKRSAFYSELSGGQKQRLALALAMLNDPQVVFLDEPTTGLDPQVRLEIHKLIEQMRSEQRTIVLTTHYIEEAERLCDRVAIIDEGRIVTVGSPREIQAEHAGQSLIEVRSDRDLPADGYDPERFQAERVTVSADRRTISVIAAKPARSVVDLVKWMEQNGFGLEDIHLKKPTLEDVFIQLTGKRLRD